MHSRRGYTLLELLLVVLFVGILFTIALSYTSTPVVTLVEDQARRFAQEVRAARASAIAEAGTAVIELDPAGGPGGEDRYRAGLLGEDEDGTGPHPGMWIDVSNGVRMSPGGLSSGPLGDPAAALDTPITIRCAATGSCDLGGPVALTFYFSHPSDPAVVRAVTLGAHGGVRSWRWSPAEGVWQ